MTIDLGSDFECPGDFLPSMLLLESDDGKARAYLQACRVRLQMPRGSLWFDRDAGTDIREFVSDLETPARAASAINAELFKDERTADCVTSITVNADGSWDIVTNAQVKDGTTYELVFRATAASSELLTAGVAT